MASCAAVSLLPFPLVLLPPLQPVCLTSLSPSLSPLSLYPILLSLPPFCFRDFFWYDNDHDQPNLAYQHWCIVNSTEYCLLSHQLSLSQSEVSHSVRVILPYISQVPGLESEVADVTLCRSMAFCCHVLGERPIPMWSVLVPLSIPPLRLAHNDIPLCLHRLRPLRLLPGHAWKTRAGRSVKVAILLSRCDNS